MLVLEKIHLILTRLPHKFLIFCVFDSKKNCERQMILKADSQEKVETSRATTSQPSEGNVSSHSPVTAPLRTQSPQTERINDEDGTCEGKPRSTSKAQELPSNPDVGGCSSHLSHLSEGELFPEKQLKSRKQLSAGELSHHPDANRDASSGNRTVATSSAEAKQACQGEGDDADASTLNYFSLLPKSTDEKASSISDAATHHSEANQSLKVAPHSSNDDISLGKTCALSQLSEQKETCRDREFENVTLRKMFLGKKKEKGPKKACRIVQSSCFSASWRCQEGTVLMESDAPRLSEAIQRKMEFPRWKESGRLWRKHKFNFCCLS